MGADATQNALAAVPTYACHPPPHLREGHWHIQAANIVAPSQNKPLSIPFDISDQPVYHIDSIGLSVQHQISFAEFLRVHRFNFQFVPGPNEGVHTYTPGTEPETSPLGQRLLEQAVNVVFDGHFPTTRHRSTLHRSLPGLV